MKKEAKAVVKQAESLGYKYVDTNCKGARRYDHPGGHSLLIQPAMSEDMARTLTKQMLAAAGTKVEVAKRRPAAVRQRQAAERVRLRREMDAHSKLLAQLRAEKARLLAGHGAALTSQQIADIEASIARTEREHAKYARLMTELPACGDHVGPRAAQHRAGSR